MNAYVASFTSGTYHTHRDCQFLRGATVADVRVRVDKEREGGTWARVLGHRYAVGTADFELPRKPLILCSACERRDRPPAPSVAAALTGPELEACMNRLGFIRNRLDAVAMDVVGWMPPEDNEAHHNAVEMLLRAHQEAGAIEALLAERSGFRAYPTPGNLERIAEELGGSAGRAAADARARGGTGRRTEPKTPVPGGSTPSAPTP